MPGHHGGHGGHGGYGAALLLDPALDCVDGVVGGDGADFGADYFHQQHPAQQQQQQQQYGQGDQNRWNNPNLPVYGALDPRNPNYQQNLYQQQMQQNQQAYGDGWGSGEGYGGATPYGGGYDPNASQSDDQVRRLERQCKELKRLREAAPRRSAQRRQYEEQLKNCESQLKTLKAQFGQQGEWGQGTPTWNPPAMTTSGAMAPVMPTFNPILNVPALSGATAPGQPALIPRTPGSAPPKPRPGPGQPGYIAPPTGRIAGEFGIETSQHGEFARTYKPTFGSEFGCQTNRKMG